MCVIVVMDVFSYFNLCVFIALQSIFCSVQNSNVYLVLPQYQKFVLYVFSYFKFCVFMCT